MAATLVLAGNAVSRTPAFASMDDNFKLDPNSARLLNDLGFMLFASATLTAILLVVAVSLATLRYRVLPRWVGWLGFPIALLLPLGHGGLNENVALFRRLQVSRSSMLRAVVGVANLMTGEIRPRLDSFPSAVGTSQQFPETEGFVDTLVLAAGVYIGGGFLVLLLIILVLVLIFR